MKLAFKIISFNFNESARPPRPVYMMKKGRWNEIGWNTLVCTSVRVRKYFDWNCGVRIQVRASISNLGQHVCRQKWGNPPPPKKYLIRKIETGIFFFERSQNWWKTTISFVMSVRLSVWNNFAPSGFIFMKFDSWIFIFRKYVEKNQPSLQSEKNNGYMISNIYFWSVYKPTRCTKFLWLDFLFH